MAICDVVTFNGENEIWDIRYNVLKDFVDKFIVCESPITFSGKEKPLYFEKIKGGYEKTIYYVIDENDPALWEMARNSPNTQYGGGAQHWLREWVQKESILKALHDAKLNSDDICFIGDVDEIWEMPEMVASPRKLKLRVYSYWLNNRSNEEFWGTLVSRFHYIEDHCLNHLRSDTSIRTKGYFGWHFTSQGGTDEVRRKLNDSYTKESYNTDWVQEHLRENITQSKDFLGRNFTYQKDESEWPEYIKKNQEKYARLCL